jgi:hypothetical protein
VKQHYYLETIVIINQPYFSEKIENIQKPRSFEKQQHNSALFNSPTKCIFTFSPEKINMILELELEDIFFVYRILL